MSFSCPVHRAVRRGPRRVVDALGRRGSASSETLKPRVRTNSTAPGPVPVGSPGERKRVGDDCHRSWWCEFGINAKTETNADFVKTGNKTNKP